MQERILIDLIKCRDCRECTVKCSYSFHPVNNGMKIIREMAAFRFTCRHCEDSPCILVCPAEALEKNNEGIIKRSNNFCVGCKSCVVACPFGTLMNDFFDYKTSSCDYCYTSNRLNGLECVNTCEHKAISIVDRDEDKSEHIYSLNEYVLVKEFIWETLKNEPSEETIRSEDFI
jgi:Fe-S-cluster-containing dehydrogenase component